MALVTVQRSPSPSNTPETGSEDLLDGVADSDSSLRSPHRSRRSDASAKKNIRKAFHSIQFVHRIRFSESYLAVKGAALILPQSECLRTVTKSPNGGDIQVHLQSMFYLLRQQDTIKVAVKLESVQATSVRYMVVVSTMGRQDTEESVILGIDIAAETATVGLVLPIWSDMRIQLDGDGGFSVTMNSAHHNFKPVSVQAMWSALQSLSKVRDVAHLYSYHPNGLTHTWVSYYRVTSDQGRINEWNRMEDLESARVDNVDESTDKAQLEKVIKTKLKEILMEVDLEEVTSKYLRDCLEADLGMGLREYRQFIDEEMIVILRQMDSASEIFDFLYLGSEWNASNLEELQENGVGYILNITREIDNFFPGMFEYMNIRVYDKEQSELMKYWDNTFKFITKARAQNSKVLVHCKMGVSRSASTVIAYAMKEYGWDLQHTLKYVKEKRSCVKPNNGFMQQLVTYQGILDASKQRHNLLWRSKSASNLEDRSARLVEETEDTHSLHQFDLTDYNTSDGSRPRSWSPDDSTAQLLLKTQDLASDNESSDEREEDECVIPEDDDDESQDIDLSLPGPSLFTMDNWEYSSRSADSLDEDLLLGSSSSDPAAERIRQQDEHPVLLRSVRSLSQCSNDSDYPDNVTEDSDLDDESAQETQVKVDRGFYDVCMLLVDIEAQGAGLRESEWDPTWGFAHPDVKIEAIMALQRKHRRIAQLLKLSQPSTNNQDVMDILRPSSGKVVDTKVPLVPPNTPLCAKLKPDNYWIKEIPPSPQEPCESKIAGTDLDLDDQGIVISVPPLAMSTPSVTALENDSKRTENIPQVPVELTQLKVPSDPKSEAVFDNDNALTVFPEQYEKEEIPWNPGAVKRQTKDLEEKIKSELFVAKERVQTLSTSSTGSGTSSGGEAQEWIPEGGRKCGTSVEAIQESEAVDLKENGAATGTRSRPVSMSIYDTEEIPMEPGLVKRTKNEIEQRERSYSLLDTLTQKDSKPVQRSSSLKAERQSARKDRNSERRKTCLPVLRPSQPADLKKTEARAKSLEPSDCLSSWDRKKEKGEDARAKSLEPSDSKQDVSEVKGQGAQVETRERSKSDTSIKVYLMGDDAVEMEEGKVKKHKRDFEMNKSGEGSDEVLQDTVNHHLAAPENMLASSRRSPSPLPDETERIPCGSVKRQKQEIEGKFRIIDSGSKSNDSSSQPETSKKLVRSNSTPVFSQEQSPTDAGQKQDSKKEINKEEKSSGAEAVNNTDSKGETNAVDESIMTPRKIYVAETPVCTGPPAYSEDDITWSVGTVRQQKEILENKAKESSQPPKKVEQGDPRYRMSPQTLRLIREVGSRFLASPLKNKDGTATPIGGGLVRRLAEDIENKSGENLVRKRLIIVEKDTHALDAHHKEVTRPKSDGLENGASVNNVERSSSFKENQHSGARKSPSPPRGAALGGQQASKTVLTSSDVQENVKKENGKTHYDEKRKSFVATTKDCLIENVKQLETTRSKDHEAEGKTVETSETEENGEERVIVKDLVGRFEPKDVVSCGDITVEMTDGTLQNSPKQTKDCEMRASPPRTQPNATSQPSSSSATLAKSSTNEPVVHRPPRKSGPKSQNGASRLSPEKTLPKSVQAVTSPSKFENQNCQSVVSQTKTVSLGAVGRTRSQTTPEDMSNAACRTGSASEEESKGRRLSLSDLSTSPESRKTSIKGHSPLDLPVKSPTSGGTGLNRVPISPQREPDPSLLPRRQRKQHGKTHPLARLSGDDSARRSKNPFYNTM